jgi:endonuclease/exonuclease/phosphatase family metal-dependent hydrolase
VTKPLRFATANIKGWLPMRQLWVNLCLYALLLTTRPDVLGTQEMWLLRYRYGRRLRDGSARGGLRGIFRGWTHIAPNTKPGTCVSLRPGLTKIASGARLLHRAVRGVCGPRWIVWVRFTYAGLAISAASVHLTPRRLSNTRAARAHVLGLDQLREWIEDEIALGYEHGAVMGDMNCSSAVLYDALGRQIRGLPVKVYASPEGHSPTGKSIDHIVLWGHWSVVDRGNDESPHSDHDPWWIDAVPLERRAA